MIVPGIQFSGILWGRSTMDEPYCQGLWAGFKNSRRPISRILFNRLMDAATIYFILSVL